MLNRIKNLVNAMVNKGVSKLETPELMLEAAQTELENNVKQVKEAITTSLTSEKMLEQRLKKVEEELAAWEKRAAVAVQQNNDEIAKQCLQKKQEHKVSHESMTQQLADQKKTTATLKERYAELGEQFKDFQRKKADLTVRAKAGEAVANAQELMSNAGSGGGMDKWEQKIREKELRGEAMRETAGKGGIDDKFKQLDEHIELEDQLAALKAQMGVAGQITTSKTEPGKSSEDDPIVVEVVSDDDKGKK